MLTESHISRLASINSIDALLAFLRDDLNWPIADASPEETTFTFTAEELGLKEEHLPQINAIYQIRPVTRDQPWGIFFIDFENKKLPVTLMRRILNALVVKKRGPTRTGVGWDAGDLLFMTTFGETERRNTAFAHFHEQAGDLPTLRVVDWNADDNPEAMRTTYSRLHSSLGWPPDTSDKEAWRQQWRAPFKHKSGHVITTSKVLAERLADLSKKIRDSVNVILEAETEKGPMTKLYSAFKEALIHDLKPADFADTFSQTITYGLFSLAVSRTPERGSGHGPQFVVDEVRMVGEITSSFLGELLATFLDVGGRKKGGIDYDEVGVQDVAELLRSDETDMRAILDDFGAKRQEEDPVIHFYEDYLKAYNKELKVKRGVFYTPQPVVSYIVRSVHELLQTEFGIEDGLASTITWGDMESRRPRPSGGEGAGGEGSGITIPDTKLPDDPFVVILDPATGTATFLVEVIDVIHRHLQNKWNTERAGCLALLRQPTTNNQNPKSFEEFWNQYVPDCLLPRLYGYELMMAPYAIAHMKVGLKLGETGYKFGSRERVRIYLTNALEPPSELQARLALDWEALAHEAQAVKAVKETERFTVVIGNPPYSGHSANASKDEKGNRNFIGNLVHDYYFVDGVPLGEKNPKWLQDDYVKFLRFGQYLIQQAGVGALGMITNHGYLDNPTFRGMRRSLMQSFDDLRFLDLHGNTKKKEVSPDGSKDENVFDIQQGVAICLLADKRRSEPEHCGSVSRADLSGMRLAKYAQLTTIPPQVSTWSDLSPNKPYYLFVEQNQSARAGYETGWRVTDAFQVYSMGVVTGQDGEVIGMTVAETLDLARRHGLSSDAISPYRYRPFDVRTIVYDNQVIGRARQDVMRHMTAGRNSGLQTVRQISTPHWCHALATNCITDSDYVSGLTSERGYLIPLSCWPTEQEVAMGIGKEPNLSPAFLDALAGAIGRRFKSGGSSAGPGGLFAEGAGPFPPGNEPFPPGNESLRPGNESLRPGNEPLPPGNEPFPSGNESSAPWKDSVIPGSGSVPPESHAAFPGVGEPLPEGSFSPEDVFHYIYGVLHSPTYRSRYAEFLKIDFPRIPLPGGPEVFDALVPLGAELVALHLMESPRLDEHMTTFSAGDHFLDKQDMIGKGADHIVDVNEMVGEGPRVEKVTYTLSPDTRTPTPDPRSLGTVYIDKAQTIGFQGVPEEVWNFHIGGYQVCEKWLKDRGPKKGKPGRILSPEDIDHYHRIVVALSETIRIMKEIDLAIEQHGGWPGAFSLGQTAAVEG